MTGHERPSITTHDHAFKQHFRSPTPGHPWNVCSPLVALCPSLGDFVGFAPPPVDSRRGTDIKAADTSAFASSGISTDEVEFPISLPEVALVTAQSENYGLNMTFDTQWSNLTPKRTTGFVFHPRTKKFYSVALYHQIHCLNALRKYIAKGDQRAPPRRTAYLLTLHQETS